MTPRTSRLAGARAAVRAPHPRRLLIAIAVAVAIVVALIPAAAGVALAHANIVRTVPDADAAVTQAPPRVEIFTSEPMTPALSSMSVLDTSGQRVDRGDSAVDVSDHTHMSVSLAQLPTGTYTVYWKNVSDVDGHPLSGTFVFYVGTKPANAPASATSKAPPILISPFEPFVRWGTLLGLLTMFGSLLFELVVLGPAMQGGAAADVRDDLDATEVVLSRLRLAALVLFGVASWGQLLVQSSESSGPLASSLALVLASSQWGHMWIARVISTLVGAFLAAMFVRPALNRVIALVLWASALLTIALSSHAAADRLLLVPGVANEVVHLVAAAVWTGGLVAFLTLALRARRAPIDERRRLLAAIAPRFSPVAFLAAGAIGVTGAYSAWIEVARVSALRTPYGLAVIAKVALFLALLALGAVNLRVLGPRLRHSGSAARALTRTVAMEVACVVLVLLAAGFLASFQPAKQAEAAQQPAPHDQQTAEGVRIRTTVDPGKIGANRVVVDLARADGTPLTNATRVGVRMQFADADLGALDLTTQAGGPGNYVADGALISLKGNWQVEVTVSRPDGFDAHAVFRFAVASAAGTGPVTSTPDRQAALLAFGWEVVGLALLLLAVSAAWWSKSRAGKVADWSGAAFAIAGILMVYGVGHVDAGQPASTVAAGGIANPIPASEQSIATGHDLFAQNCVTCHGLTGLGDGPAAKALVPPPANLVTHVPLHSDGELFQFIAGGFPGSAMPSFKGQLTDDQLWHLVNYLRTLK